jgi:hypothetical protein
LDNLRGGIPIVPDGKKEFERSIILLKEAAEIILQAFIEPSQWLEHADACGFRQGARNLTDV